MRTNLTICVFLIVVMHGISCAGPEIDRQTLLAAPPFFESELGRIAVDGSLSKNGFDRPEGFPSNAPPPQMRLSVIVGTVQDRIRALQDGDSVSSPELIHAWVVTNNRHYEVDLISLPGHLGRVYWSTESAFASYEYGDYVECVVELRLGDSRLLVKALAEFVRDDIDDIRL